MKTGRCIDLASRSWCGVSKDKEGLEVLRSAIQNRGGQVSKVSSKAEHAKRQIIKSSTD